MRTFVAYLLERFRLWLFGPVAMLFWAAGLWAVATIPTLATAVGSAAFVALLLLQFRLWDDLEDRVRDARLHPRRVLVRSSPAPFWRLLAALGATAIVLPFAAGRYAAAFGVAALTAVAWLAYRRLRSRLPERAWDQHVLLLKYPGFVWLAATFAGVPRPGRLAIAMLVAYLSARAYEIAHTQPIDHGAAS